MYTAQWYLALEVQIVITIIALVMGRIAFKISWQTLLLASLLCFSVPVVTPPGLLTYLLPADLALPLLLIIALTAPKTKDRRIVWFFAITLLLWPVLGTLFHAVITAFSYGWVTFLYRRLLLVCLFYLGATGKFTKTKGIDIIQAVMIIWTFMTIVGVLQVFGFLDVDFSVRTADWANRRSILETVSAAQRGFLGLDRGAVGTYGSGMIAIATALFLFEPKIRKPELILYLSCIIFSGLVIFLIGSRTGILATSGALAYLAFASLKSLKRVRKARFVSAAVLLGPIVIYKSLQFLALASGRISDSYRTAASLEHRLSRQLSTLEYAVSNFRGAIFGFGGAALGYTQAVFGLGKPHNEYLQHLQDSGWIGLITYMLLMVLIFKRFRPRVGPDLAVYGVVGRAALFSGMICGLATSFFTFTSEDKFIYGMVISFVFGRLCFEMQKCRQPHQIDPSLAA